MVVSTLLFLLQVAAVLLVVFIAFGIFVLRAAQRHLGIEPPTPAQLTQEDHDTHALFRHFPQLIKKVAWIPLGSFPTPVEKATFKTPDGKQVEIQVKREDLSSQAYGGNKVRTLQHTLGIVQAGRSRNLFKDGIVALGSSGTNQVVATLVHAKRHLPDCEVEVVFVGPDKPELSNTLNFLSVLSYPLRRFTPYGGFEGKHFILQILRALWGGRERCALLTVGGNSTAGCLGQVSGMLELADQIVAGECEDPDAVFVPIGSSCTVSGLVAGAAIARALGIKAFQKPGFKVVGVVVHHAAAALNRVMNIETSIFSSGIPITVGFTVRDVCRSLRELGAGDFEQVCLDFMNAGGIEIIDAKELVGIYGAHSEESKGVAAAFDDSFSAKSGKTPWLCGHFSSKAVAAIVRASNAAPREGEHSFLFWSTKSLVQPRGSEDEWKRFLHLARESPKLLDWALKGGEQVSKLRPARVDPGEGDTEGARQAYRKLMTMQ